MYHFTSELTGFIGFDMIFLIHGMKHLAFPGIILDEAKAGG